MAVISVMIGRSDAAGGEGGRMMRGFFMTVMFVKWLNRKQM